MEMASNLALYASTPLPAALGLPQSIAVDFFSGKPFEDWKKGREAEMKAQAGIAGRLNEVIRGLGVVASAVAGRRR